MACTGFVEDGEERLWAAWNASVRPTLETAVRPQVESEYAVRLASATFLGRWRLRRTIEREIRRRTDPDVSPEALF